MILLGLGVLDTQVRTIQQLDSTRKRLKFNKSGNLHNRPIAPYHSCTIGRSRRATPARSVDRACSLPNVARSTDCCVIDRLLRDLPIVARSTDCCETNRYFNSAARSVDSAVRSVDRSDWPIAPNIYIFNQLPLLQLLLMNYCFCSVPVLKSNC